MLADLFSFLTTAPGGGVDPDRATALTALQALVGTRVYPDLLRERATMPALVYQLVNQTHDHILDGDPIDIEYPRVQIDVWADSAVQRELIGGYITKALDGFIGVMGATDVGLLQYESESNLFEAESKQYRKSMDFKVIHYS